MEVAEEYNKRHQALLSDMGSPHPTNPEMYKIDDEKLQDYRDKAKEMEDEVLNLNLKPIKMSRFGDTFAIAPDDLLTLEWMFTDDISESPKKDK